MKKYFRELCADAKHELAQAYKTRSRRVLLACELPPWIMILIGMIILCSLDLAPWVLAVSSFIYCLLIIFDSEHLVSIIQCIVAWIILILFILRYFIPEFVA